MKEQLKVKDLITIGVFVVIYFIFMFAVGMIGLIPILFLCYPTILGIVSSTIVIFFMSKVQKPFALLIFGIISPIIMFICGHTYILVLLSSVSIILAELIRKLFGYKTLKGIMFSYPIFNTWICASLMQMLLIKEKYLEMCKMMGADYANTLEQLISYKSMFLVYVGAILGGIIGSYIAKFLLKKHFQKAGLINV